MKFLIDTDKKEITVYENTPLNKLIGEIGSIISVDWDVYKLIIANENKISIGDLLNTAKNNKLVKPFVPDTHISPYRYNDNLTLPNKYTINCSCGKSTCGICNNLALNL